MSHGRTTAVFKGNTSDYVEIFGIDLVVPMRLGPGVNRPFPFSIIIESKWWQGQHLINVSCPATGVASVLQTISPQRDSQAETWWSTDFRCVQVLCSILGCYRDQKLEETMAGKTLQEPLKDLHSLRWKIRAAHDFKYGPSSFSRLPLWAHFMPVAMAQSLWAKFTGNFYKAEVLGN